VAIDEFPYLAKANPELPSLIQAAFGPRREQRLRSRTRLLLCGSAMSFMGRLLSGTAPLRGRAGLEMIVSTLDYRLAAQFWEIEDPVLGLLLYSIVGGTPAYRDGVADGNGPGSVEDLDRWVTENVLSRFSPLFREARYLLAEEPDIRDNAVYHSVLSAVAEGNSTRGGIASYLERKATDISHHLSVLEDAGLLARDVDVFRPGRSVYRISEPLIAFYHAIMRPEWSRLERRGQAEQVWRDSAHRFATNVVGPRFEQVCRDWMQAYAPPEVNGIPVSQVGSGQVNDPEQRKSHEIDVAAFGHDADGRRVLLVIGEAKWSETLGTGHLARLRRIKDLLIRTGQPGAETARLFLFGSTEPSPQLRAAAAAGEVQLIGLHDLYE
jgi:AAA+ ATPase superfamily predicted ATPase